MTEFMEDLDYDIMSIIVDDWKPKNGLRAIIKGSKDKQIIIKGMDNIKGLLFGTVVSSGIKDKDEHEITNDEVEKSCWNYQTKLIEKGFKVDLNHDGKIIDGVKIVENHVDRSTENYSHNIVIDFHENKELMEKAVNSSIQGISPKGHARIVEKGTIEKAIDKLINFFSKNENTEIINKGEKDMTKDEIMAMTNEQLKEYGVCKIAEPETSKETLVKAEPEKAPETISKADFDAYKAEQDAKVEALKTELIEVAKGRATGSDELTPEIDINKMSEEELKTLRETKPEIYKAALDKAAKKK